MGNMINDLIRLHNTLVALHPTGEDILIVADAVMQVRNLLQQASKPQEESSGGDGCATL